MAVPTQAFAAEKCDIKANLINNGNFSNIYNQIAKQFNVTSNQNQTTVQVNPTTKAAPATQAQPKKERKPEEPAEPNAKAASTATPTASNLGAYEQQVVNLVNKERAAVGLPALKVNTKLAGVAEKKAEDLRDNNYFAHQSPTYGSPFDMMKQFGISYTSAGENIAKGQQTPEAVMNGWMNSQGHKDNILNSSFTEIGVGYVTDSNGNTYWVQHFIRP